MANTIEVTDSFIKNSFIGDQTYQTVSENTQHMVETIKGIESQGKPVRILVDLSQLGAQGTEARRGATEALQSLHYEKMAIYGGKAYLKYLVNFVVHATGVTHKVQYLATEAEATQWLTSN